MKKVILTSAVVLTIFAACTKTTTPSGTGDKKTYLTKAPWKFISIEGKAAGTTVWVNVTSQVTQPCDNDNIVTFATNNTYVVDEGATVCTVGNPQIEESGTWAFLNNETTLNNIAVSGPGSPTNDTASIATLNDNTLALDHPDGSNGVFRITYGH